MSQIETSGTAFRSVDRNNRTVTELIGPFAPEDWTADGLCAAPELLQLTHDSWYADPGSVEGIRAQAVCTACPVRSQCLRAARERGEQFGIWSEDQNDPKLTRCAAGHWMTDESVNQFGKCKTCRREQQAARRRARRIAA